MEKLNTCRIFKEKSFATKPLQRTRKTREVILQIKWISKEILWEKCNCIKTYLGTCLMVGFVIKPLKTFLNSTLPALVATFKWHPACSCSYLQMAPCLFL